MKSNEELARVITIHDGTHSTVVVVEPSPSTYAEQNWVFLNMHPDREGMPWHWNKSGLTHLINGLTALRDEMQE